MTACTPIAAGAILFGTYFLFNLQYPTEVAATLEFIQRLERMVLTE